MAAGIVAKVAVPWGFSRYIPLNGFHPLYRPLFDGEGSLEFRGVDLAALARALEHALGFAGEVRRHAAAAGRRFIDAMADEDFAAEFLHAATLEELWAAGDLPGELEFHHTSPFTTGTRPFVLHCESFLPVFFPFFQQGAGTLERWREVRAFYRRLLASPNCVGILSHMPGTLADLSAFFADPAIDAKLGQTRIGILERHLRRLCAAKREGRPGGPVFLVTSSAHQQTSTIALRGARVSLLFAERYLRAGHPGRFILRTARLPDRTLREWGLDAAYLRSQEPARIEWLEQRLDDDALLDLYAAADVLLLPSVNLHSVTLMQALAAGAVPVVTDTFGPSEFVHDDETGIVLRGVRDRVWTRHEGAGVLVDSHAAYGALAGDLVAQLFERLPALLANPAALAAMRERMRAVARTRHSGDAMRDGICEDLARRLRSAPAAPAARPPSVLERAGAVRRDGWERLFEMPPAPRRRQETAGEQVFAGGGAVYRIRGGRIPGLDQWSPFALHAARLLGRGRTRLFADDAAMRVDSERSPGAARVMDACAIVRHTARRFGIAGQD